MEACYMLRDLGHVDIWGDDFEPLGMLVQLSQEGEIALKNGHYDKNSPKGISRKAIGALATLTAIIALVIGINKSTAHKTEKGTAPDSNKSKTASLKSGSSLYDGSTAHN